MFRVEVRNTDCTLVDYSPMKKTKVVVKRGVRYEALPEAKKKYNRMLRTGDRFVKPSTDIGRINQFEDVKRFKRRRRL